MKRQLDPELYNLLKSMDFSSIDDDIVFYDDEYVFETSSEFFDCVFDENIVSKGMDEEQEECNEYGRKLYGLYDLLFFSNYGEV